MREPTSPARGTHRVSAASLLVGLVVAGVACGPIEYMNQVSSRASKAVVAAREAGAERLAPYEYTAAVQYLHQARAEAAYSFYQASIEFGRKAEEMAGKARALAASRRPGKAVESGADVLKDASKIPGAPAAPEAQPTPAAPAAPPSAGPEAPPVRP